MIGPGVPVAMRSVTATLGFPEFPARARRAVDTYVAFGAVSALLGTIHVANALAGEFFGSGVGVEAYYGLDGLAVWVALQLATYGAIGIGGTVLYRRGVGLDGTLPLPTEEGARLLVGVAAVVAGTAAVVLLTPATVGVYPNLFVERFGRAVAVRGPANPAPYWLVYSVVLATRLLVVAPAFGIVVHGVFQSTLRETAGPAVGVAGTALLVVVTVAPLTPGFVARSDAVSLVAVAAVLFAVAAAVGYAHERTGTLLFPAAGYALFVAAMAADAVVGNPYF